MAVGKTIFVFDVTIMNTADVKYYRSTVQAKTKVRAFMKALALSPWKGIDPDLVTYHADEICSFDNKVAD